MSGPKANIIPYLSKRFVQKNSSNVPTSRIMRHVLKETAKMAEPDQPRQRTVVQKSRDLQ